jgi:hypothetical protein
VARRDEIFIAGLLSRRRRPTYWLDETAPE